MISFDNVKVFTDNLEEKALEQLHTLVNTGVFSNMPIRIMPDVHAGAGCVIGFTAKIADKIIPNIVGVDIGCGMLCVYLGKCDINFADVDDVIKKKVPYGMNVNEVATDFAHEFIDRLICKDKLVNMDWLERSLMSLGGGNHFIEIDEDEEGGKYLVIHSGSRNLGKQVAQYYQDVAIKECKHRDTKSIIEKLKSEGREKEIATELAKIKKKKLPDSLCYLQGESMQNYLHDMQVCTKFADWNRLLIADTILKELFGLAVSDVYHYFTTIHNYIGKDGYIRKGAISARKGERVLIPLNMRDGCIIGIGKGVEGWNYSAPHGAGRVLSRKKAKEEVSVQEFVESMKEVYSTTVNESTLDESPFAYKPSEEIISLVQDTIDIERVIRPIYNFKASE